MESTPSDFHNVSCSRRLISTSGRPYFICSERSKPRRPAGTVVLGRLGHSLIRGAQTPNMNTRGLNGRGSIDINRWLSYGWCCLFSQTWSKANFRKPQMACRSNDVMSPLTSIDYIYICNYTDNTYICSQQNIGSFWPASIQVSPPKLVSFLFGLNMFKLPLKKARWIATWLHGFWDPKIFSPSQH